MKNQAWIVIIAIVGIFGVIACIILSVVGAVSVGVLARSQAPAPEMFPGAAGSSNQEAEVSEATPVKLETAAPVEFSIENELATTAIPDRDRYDLAVRFNNLDPAIPARPASREYEVGEVDLFFVNNSAEQTTIEVEAELVYVSGQVYAWVEVGETVDQRTLRTAIDEFALEAVPAALDLFTAPDFEVDKFHVLHTAQISTGIAGYYFSPSEYTREVVPTSNEKSMFFINLNNTRPASSHYNAVLAHEFQHLVHWHQDQNEETWLNEGYSELSARVAGYGQSDFIPEFARNPGVQLNNWPELGSTSPHYAASYLFSEYLFEEYGEDVIRALAREPGNGLDGVDIVLGEQGYSTTADDVFADWTLSNYLNASGQYGYDNITFAVPDIKDVLLLSNSGTFLYQNSVSQYGTDYLLLDAGPNISITFTSQEFVGEKPNTVPLVNAVTTDTDGDTATDDRFVWWSNRGDDINPRLTRAFNLTAVDSATLIFDTWFNIEELWDYAYVSVSTDGGMRWDILRSSCTTSENPYGNAYGIGGYTGLSSDCPVESNGGWFSESLDLTPYAGNDEVLIRFEMVTDDAVNNPGLLIDNIVVPEIGFYDDGEQGIGDWQAEGFVLTDNTLTQRFIVQAVRFEADGTPVIERVSLDENNVGSLSISSPGGAAVLAVSGATRYTTELASYSVEIRESTSE